MVQEKPEQPSSKRRDPATIGQIGIDPHVLAGKPCIAGTRISVELILAELSAGRTANDLLQAYPHLDRQDVYAALDHARKVMRSRHVGHSRPTETQTAKDKALRVIEDQPPDSSLDDLIRELAIHRMIDRGLADSDAGRVISHEAIKKEVATWRKKET